MKRAVDRLYSVEQAQAYELQLVEQGQITWTKLIEMATDALLKRVIACVVKNQSIVVVCGRGLNGADGLGLAVKLAMAKREVSVCTVDGMDTAKKLTQKAHMAAKNRKIPCVGPEALVTFDVVVDALWGIGTQGVQKACYKRLIEAINNSGAHVISIDCPSGLNANTGKVEGLVVKAERTISLMMQKKGLFTADAYDYVGKVVFDDLSICEEHALPQTEITLVDPENGRQLGQDDKNNVQKYDFGRVIIAAGRDRYRGAGVIAAEAAARSGCGLVSLIDADPTWSTWVEVNFTQIDFEDCIKEYQQGYVQSMVIGPGLGKSDVTRKLIQWGMGLTVPVVYDADALHVLASMDVALADNHVIVPHEAEAAVLLGLQREDVEGDRFAAVDALIERYQCVVLLKGPGTIIGSKKERLVISGACATLAVAGSGDCLAGLIAGYLAQGYRVKDACVKAASVHLTIGLQLSSRNDGRGALATDIVEMIPKVQ